MQNKLQVTSHEGCLNCSKNSVLIRKYEQLLHLYKKKQAKLSLSISRNSYLPTSSNTLQTNSIDRNCKKMIEVLQNLIKRRCLPLFRMVFCKSVKKFLILNLSNRIDKCAKKITFDKLKNLIKQQRKITQQVYPQDILNNNQIDNTQKLNNENSVIQLFLSESNSCQQTKFHLQKRLGEQLRQIKNRCNLSDYGYKYYQRRSLQLQIINKKLKIQNQLLKQSLENSMKRLTKQIQKKQENLIMFGEDISQKNQQIQNLKLIIKQYQQSHPHNGNILQNEVVSLKKQIDEHQKLNKRLNDDLDKIKSQLAQISKRFKLSEQNNLNLNKQLLQQRKSNFQMGLKSKNYDKRIDQYLKLIKLIEKKIKRLNIYQKQWQSNVCNRQIQTTNNVIQQIKSEIILLFLNNLSDTSYKLQPQNLFDEDEKALLFAHKEAWIDYEQKISQMNKVSPVHKNVAFDISEIAPKQDQMISVFQPMQIEHSNILQHKNKQQRKQGVTMRVIQLELEIKKQVEKISQLKEQFLHIRIVILNLLKSLQLQTPLKQSSMDILRVLFDFFQYSQQQRQSIFIKKKKMFGFM